MMAPQRFLVTAFILILLLSIQVSAFIDLAVNSTWIVFSSSNPVEGENVTVNATIANLGDEDAANILVQFLDDQQVFSNITLNISAFSTEAVSGSFMPDIGQNIVTVIVDPHEVINETEDDSSCDHNEVKICHVADDHSQDGHTICVKHNAVPHHLMHGDHLGPCASENNNIASKVLSVSAYQIYYGNSAGKVGLGIGNNFLLGWDKLGCNIMVADTDSNVDFTSLQAIGRRKNIGPALNDFIDIDLLLGMTDFDDSIAALWTLFGQFHLQIFKLFPRKVETFTIFEENITSVPVVNSTNSSAFRTGILWDTSDDNSGFFGQFDTTDREDLIFVTKVNTSKQGAFGVYDYEIKVPALLRDYKLGSSTVEFFVDLDSC